MSLRAGPAGCDGTKSRRRITIIHVNLPVSILTRSGSGDRAVHRYLYSTPTSCYEALTDPKQPIIGKNDEILLVTLGDFSLYSKLASDKVLTIDDLTDFFA